MSISYNSNYIGALLFSVLTFCSNWYNLKDGQLVAVAFLNTRGRPSSIRCDIKAHLHLFRFKNMSQVHISPSVYDKIKWPQSKLDWKVLVRPLLVPKTCVSVGNIASDNWSLLANQKRSLTVHFLRVTSWPTLRPPWVTVLKSFLDSQMVSFWPRKVLWQCKPRSFQNFEITEGLNYYCKELILPRLQIFQAVKRVMFYRLYKIQHIIWTICNIIWSLLAYFT